MDVSSSIDLLFTRPSSTLIIFSLGGLHGNTKDCEDVIGGHVNGCGGYQSINRGSLPTGTSYSLRLDNRSRMSREVHVRFSESARVKFPRATRRESSPGVGSMAINYSCPIASAKPRERRRPFKLRNFPGLRSSERMPYASKTLARKYCFFFQYH